jgi:hypothetical protein
MPKWPRYPMIYEINAWVWLSELSEKAGAIVDLGSVPSGDWDAIVELVPWHCHFSQCSRTGKGEISQSCRRGLLTRTCRRMIGRSGRH